MSTRRRVLAALGASALGGCAAFPRDRAAPTTNLATGPQLHVDLSYDDAAETLRCVVDMGTTVTPENVGRVAVTMSGRPNVVWVSVADLPKRMPAEPKQSFPLEPGDSLEIDVDGPPGEVSVTAWDPDGNPSGVYGSREFGTVADSQSVESGGLR
ncbi:hypothetical protein [Halorubellus salinus]|uniref:hypothetical protein n=1 Tax=Halorubellus salinus TaxID=755309 RepID=UPI001D082C44|nr:hypothetical protein [Halorubellus salinus]